MPTCLRCGKEFDDPVPEITNEGGRVEIATNNWCAACNKIAMAALYRTASAYYEGGMRPPWQSEAKDNVTPTTTIQTGEMAPDGF